MAHGNPGPKVAGHLNDRHDFRCVGFTSFPSLSLRSETAFQPAAATSEAGFFLPAVFSLLAQADNIVSPCRWPCRMTRSR
jgi:hypothetical protein